MQLEWRSIETQPINRLNQVNGMIRNGNDIELAIKLQEFTVE